MVRISDCRLQREDCHLRVPSLRDSINLSVYPGLTSRANHILSLCADVRIAHDLISMRQRLGRRRSQTVVPAEPRTQDAFTPFAIFAHREPQESCARPE